MRLGLSRAGPARAAYDELVEGGVPGGVLTPLEVLTTKHGRARGLGRPEERAGAIDGRPTFGPSGSLGGTSDIIAIPRQRR